MNGYWSCLSGRLYFICPVCDSLSSAGFNIAVAFPFALNFIKALRRLCRRDARYHSNYRLRLLNARLLPIAQLTVSSSAIAASSSTSVGRHQAASSGTPPVAGSLVIRILITCFSTITCTIYFQVNRVGFGLPVTAEPPSDCLWPEFRQYWFGFPPSTTSPAGSTITE